MTAGVITFRVVTLVTQLHVNLFFAGAEFNQPLTGAGILRVRISGLRSRITGPKRNQSSNSDDHAEGMGINEARKSARRSCPSVHFFPPCRLNGLGPLTCNGQRPLF